MHELAGTHTGLEWMVLAGKKVDYWLDKTARRIQMIAHEAVQPIKDRLPASLLITAVPDKSVANLRLGVYEVWEFLPVEGKLVVVVRQYLEERKTADGRTHVCSLDQPRELSHADGDQNAWLTHGRLVLKRLNRAASDLHHGDKVLSSAEEMERLHLIRVGS